MVSKRDYYEVLGVDRSATDGEISEAYRKAALEHHPDRNPGDEEAVDRFKEAAEAFEVLHNPDKRARYDRFGHAGLDGPGGGAPHFHDVSDIFEAFGSVFGDSLFGDFFGGGRRRQARARPGADVRCEVSLDLLEAARGISKEIRFKRHEQCAICRGTGAKPGTQPEACRYCGGQGRVVQSTGIFSLQTTCPSCKGAGTMIREPCTSCGGSGFVLKNIRRKVNIPAGVDNGTRLRIPGEGEPSPGGGPRGDCYCFIAVNPHPLFERDGQHLICQIPISYSQAVLGATIEVPTLNGREDLTLPPGTATGHVFKLKGRGMPDPRYGKRGHLLVQVHIEVPAKLTAVHEKILRKLAEFEHTHVTPKRKSFVEKLKDYFVPHGDPEQTED